VLLASLFSLPVLATVGDVCIDVAGCAVEFWPPVSTPTRAGRRGQQTRSQEKQNCHGADNPCPTRNEHCSIPTQNKRPFSFGRIAPPEKPCQGKTQGRSRHKMTFSADGQKKSLPGRPRADPKVLPAHHGPARLPPTAIEPHFGIDTRQAMGDKY